MISTFQSYFEYSIYAKLQIVTVPTQTLLSLIVKLPLSCKKLPIVLDISSQ